MPVMSFTSRTSFVCQEVGRCCTEQGVGDGDEDGMGLVDGEVVGWRGGGEEGGRDAFVMCW